MLSAKVYIDPIKVMRRGFAKWSQFRFIHLPPSLAKCSMSVPPASASVHSAAVQRKTAPRPVGRPRNESKRDSYGGRVKQGMHTYPPHFSL